MTIIEEICLSFWTPCWGKSLALGKIWKSLHQQCRFAFRAGRMSGGVEELQEIQERMQYQEEILHSFLYQNQDGNKRDEDGLLVERIYKGEWTNPVSFDTSIHLMKVKWKNQTSFWRYNQPIIKICWVFLSFVILS